MKIKNPIPQTPELWLDEIARAFNDTACAIPFGPMTGSLITPNILFQLAPCACLKFRGVKITDKNLKDPTDAALTSYIVTKDNRPDAFTSPQISFAFCYLASHMGCRLLDEEDVNSIMIYIEENEENLLDSTEESLEDLEDYVENHAQEEDPFYNDIETCYTQMRETGIRINSKLTRMLDKDDISTAARRLGLMGKDNTLILGSEDEFPILMDYCIHSVLRDGKNLIDHCLNEKRNEFSSDEIPYLTALTKSHYTMIRTETAQPGVGIHVLDLFYDQDIFLADYLLSESAEPDIIFAGRLIPFPNFYMTTGTMLPVLPESVKGMQKILKMIKTPLSDKMSKEAEDKLSSNIIALLLKENSISNVAYGGPDDDIDELMRSKAGAYPPPDYNPQPTTHKRDGPKIGRNEPCPCGSGKKYKKCCGKR